MTPRLVLEGPIHSSQGLHQTVALERFVDVHGGQGGRIKAGQPHVADDGDSEIGLGVLEAVTEVHTASTAADVFAPSVRIGSRPGHDDLHHALIVPLAVPFRMELLEQVVEVNTNLPGGADDHGFPRWERLPACENVGLHVTDDVLQT